MSLPIRPTPKLNKQESKIFLEKIESGLRQPVTLVPTPKLKEAEKIVNKYALKEK